jgi:hypothetical protein
MLKKILSRIGQGLLVLFFLFLGLFVIPYFNNIVMPWDRSGAIESALEWGGLAGLPESAENISVETEGSMFTREFIIEFNCDKTDIDEWIKRSGLNDLKPLREQNGIKVYQVEGQNGAVGGYVYVDKNEDNIIIDMSWS